jgi:hypothetical protein
MRLNTGDSLSFKPDVDREHQQDHRYQERDAPAPIGEGFGFDVEAREPDHDEGEEEAERRRGLNEARGVAAIVRPRVFGDVGGRAAILAAQRETLEQPQAHEQDRGQPADGRKRGQQADAEGRAAHHHDGDEEGVFAADEVTDAAEDERAERAHQEAGGVGRKRRQQRRGVISGWKEQRGEEGCQRGVEIEVVPFEYGAERGGEDHSAFVARHSFRRLAGQRQRGHGKFPQRSAVVGTRTAHRANLPHEATLSRCTISVFAPLVVSRKSESGLAV